jgi:hypothetical protein
MPTPCHRSLPLRLPCRASLAAVAATCALAATLAAAPLAAAATDEAVSPIYEEIRIEIPTSADAMRLLGEIPDIEFLIPDGPGGYRAVSTTEVDQRIEALGFRVAVLVPDLAARYAASAGAGPNFGAYHTYSETEAFLDSISAAFPSITTDKASIGTSIQGRSIWAIKVSDNPDVDEAEPEVLFDGCTHAREVMTVEMALSYLGTLTAGYGVDPLITFLVDNREIWFVPILNPDGYVYNETTNPSGGGLWRKNRRDNGNGTFGVDLNRNYAHGWGGLGSSGTPSSETYRGTAPNSEPEVQAIENFINARRFVTHQSLHSYAGMVLLPWGYNLAVHTPDDSLLRAIGDEMASVSGYLVGQPGEILYNASGVAFDWAYVDTAGHDKIFGYTTEIGGSGFWPQQSEVAGLLAENVWSHLYLTQIAGPYLTIADAAVTAESGGTVNARLDAGESVEVTLGVKNGGVLAGIASGTATLASSDAYVSLTAAQVPLGAFAPDETHALAAPFAFDVDAACPSGHEIAFTVTFRGDSGYVSIDNVSLVVDTLTGGSGNAAPGAPIAIGPTGGATTGGAPALIVQSAIDPEGDSLAYGFRVYDDTLLTSVVAAVDGVIGAPGSTSWVVDPPLADGAYLWRAFADDGTTRGAFSAPAAFGVASGTAVGPAPDDPNGATPGDRAALLPPRPSPTRDATRVAYDLPLGGRVFIVIVNAEGRVVRILEDGWRDAGRHESVWDGRDGHGHAAPSGTYLLRLEAGADRRTERVTLIR